MGSIPCHICDKDGIQNRAWFCEDHGILSAGIWYTSRNKDGMLVEPKYEKCKSCKCYRENISHGWCTKCTNDKLLYVD